MANFDSGKHATDQQHESYADDAKARRVLLVDSTSGTFSATNPIPVSIQEDATTGMSVGATVDWNGNSECIPGVFQEKDIIATQSATTQKHFEVPLRIPPRCDIKVSGKATVAGATIAASINLWIEKLD